MSTPLGNVLANANDPRIQLGSVVTLNSGGPSMTVVSVGPDKIGGAHEHAECWWFEGITVLYKTFPLFTLRLSAYSLPPAPQAPPAFDPPQGIPPGSGGPESA